MPKQANQSQYDYLQDNIQDVGSTRLVDPYAAAGDPRLTTAQSRQIRRAPIIKNAALGFLAGAAGGPIPAVLGGIAGGISGYRRGKQDLNDVNSRLAQEVSANKAMIQATNDAVAARLGNLGALAQMQGQLAPGTQIPTFGAYANTTEAEKDLGQYTGISDKYATRYQNFMANQANERAALEAMQASAPDLYPAPSRGIPMAPDVAVEQGILTGHIDANQQPGPDDYLYDPRGLQTPTDFNQNLTQQRLYRQLPGKLANVAAQTEQSKSSTALNRARVPQVQAQTRNINARTGLVPLQAKNIQSQINNRGRMNAALQRLSEVQNWLDDTDAPPEIQAVVGGNPGLLKSIIHLYNPKLGGWDYTDQELRDALNPPKKGTAPAKTAGKSTPAPKLGNTYQ